LKNGRIINEQSISDGTNNSFRNGVFTLLPVNKDPINGEVMYIACPLSPKKLGDNEKHVKTISNLVRLFFENQIGEQNDSFDKIARDIQAKVKIEDEFSGEKYNFNPKTIEGLNNIIKLFTYGRISRRDDLGLDKEQHEGKYVFGINQISPDITIMSFGQVGYLKSLKFQKGEGGIGLFVKDSDGP